MWGGARGIRRLVAETQEGADSALDCCRRWMRQHVAGGRVQQRDNGAIRDQFRSNINHPAAMTDRQTLLASFEALMEPARFKDFAPNGLQVEGRSPIVKLVSGVTASRALIEAAVKTNADAIFVHHGLFWRGHDGRVSGWLKQRLATLLEHDINLFAYHLPLDAHPVLGNNAQLALQLGFEVIGRFGEQMMVWKGVPAKGSFPDSNALACHVQGVLGRRVECVPGHDRPVQRIAWCTGGAQGYFEAAIAEGVDAFITGEISEPQMHYAREMGVSFLACGHHATERFGAPAMAGHVAKTLGIAHEFIDIDNPA